MKKRKTRLDKIRKRRKKRGLIYEIDTVPVYRRFDKYSESTVKVSYFNDWCVSQVGMSWDDAMESLLEFRHSFPEIEDYWKGLRNDFYEWAQANGVRGWGVHMYPDMD